MKLYANNEFLTKVQVVKDTKVQEEIKRFLKRLKSLNASNIIPELIYCGDNTYSKKISYYYIYMSIDSEKTILVDFAQK